MGEGERIRGKENDFKKFHSSTFSPAKRSNKDTHDQNNTKSNKNHNYYDHHNELNQIGPDLDNDETIGSALNRLSLNKTRSRRKSFGHHRSNSLSFDSLDRINQRHLE